MLIVYETGHAALFNILIIFKDTMYKVIIRFIRKDIRKIFEKI